MRVAFLALTIAAATAWGFQPPCCPADILGNRDLTYTVCTDVTVPMCQPKNSDSRPEPTFGRSQSSWFDYQLQMIQASQQLVTAQPGCVILAGKLNSWMAAEAVSSWNPSFTNQIVLRMHDKAYRLCDNLDNNGIAIMANGTDVNCTMGFDLQFRASQCNNFIQVSPSDFAVNRIITGGDCTTAGVNAYDLTATGITFFLPMNAQLKSSVLSCDTKPSQSVLCSFPKGNAGLLSGGAACNLATQTSTPAIAPPPPVTSSPTPAPSH
jgi:hypothetical protein